MISHNIPRDTHVVNIPVTNTHINTYEDIEGIIIMICTCCAILILMYYQLLQFV